MTESEQSMDQPASGKKGIWSQLDWITTLVPFICILILCILFMINPEGPGNILASIRYFLGDELESYYMTTGPDVFLYSLYTTSPRYGHIKLGSSDKPEYSTFKRGSMMFTAGPATDILFYSLCEWMLYAAEPHISDMGSIQDWASTYPLFHWGPIPWSFYMVLAVAFGFMLHVWKRNNQKYFEACRPILGKHVDSV